MTLENPPLPTSLDRLLRLSDLVELTALSRATIYRLMNAGSFPPPIRIGGINRWPAHELVEFIEAHKATRTSRGV